MAHTWHHPHYYFRPYFFLTIPDSLSNNRLHSTQLMPIEHKKLFKSNNEVQTALCMPIQRNPQHQQYHIDHPNIQAPYLAPPIITSDNVQANRYQLAQQQQQQQYQQYQGAQRHRKRIPPLIRITEFLKSKCNWQPNRPESTQPHQQHQIYSHQPNQQAHSTSPPLITKNHESEKKEETVVQCESAEKSVIPPIPFLNQEKGQTKRSTPVKRYRKIRPRPILITEALATMPDFLPEQKVKPKILPAVLPAGKNSDNSALSDAKKMPPPRLPRQRRVPQKSVQPTQSLQHEALATMPAFLPQKKAYPKILPALPPAVKNSDNSVLTDAERMPPPRLPRKRRVPRKSVQTTQSRQ